MLITEDDDVVFTFTGYVSTNELSPDEGRGNQGGRVRTNLL